MKSQSLPAKSNVVTPYNALLADIRLFIAKHEAANNPKTASRGPLAISQLQWLGECVRTADALGYDVRVSPVKGKEELEFLLIERTTQPTYPWRWRL